MTDCSRQLILEFYQDKDLTADFKGGRISSDAGLLTVRVLEEEPGIGPLRPPRPRRHRAQAPCTAAPACLRDEEGYEDCNDHDCLRDDHVLKLGGG